MRIEGIDAGDRSGRSVTGAGDVNGDGSNDNTPDARFWIDFADGEDFLSSASTEAVTLNRSSGPFPMPAAQVSWRLQSNRQNWTTAEVTVRYLDSELLAAENALELVFSPNGSAPFTPLASQVNPHNNTIRASITQPGFIFIGRRELPDPIFNDRFASPPP